MKERCLIPSQTKTFFVGDSRWWKQGKKHRNTTDGLVLDDEGYQFFLYVIQCTEIVQTVQGWQCLHRISDKLLLT